MTGQDLEGLGCAPDVWRNDVEEDVSYDTPVEVEGDLSNEQHDEHDVDVLVSQEHPDGEEDGAEDDTHGTDQGIRTRILRLELGGEHHAQRDAHDAGHHGHHTEDKFNIRPVNLSVLGFLGQEAGLDEVWTKPGESSEAEGDTGESHRGEDETLVLRETDDVLLKEEFLGQ